jgi:hypothetical protein
MITMESRNIIRALFAQGKRKKEIARILGIDPKSVRSILVGETDEACSRKDTKAVDPDLLREVLHHTDGYIQRAYEILTEEHKIDIAYSTLTRLVRKSGFLENKDHARHFSVGDVPGEEMQQDTSTYHIKLGERSYRLIASGLYFRYSKMRYIKFYPYFNRFMMKCFFHEALTYLGYAAGRCVIDNTNLAVLHGTGKDAVFHPEMIQFAKPFGFEWFAHEKGHANRKAGKERNFWTLETNFLTGRTFLNMADLNSQAFVWAAERYARRPQARTRLIPVALFENEKPYLVKLPLELPLPCRALERGTDQHGYVAVNANYYWIPGKSRPNTKIIEYEKKIKIYPENEDPIEYDLPDWTVRNAKYSPKGVDTNPYGEPRNLKKSSEEEEQKLRSLGQATAEYLDFVKSLESGIRYKPRFIRSLYALTKKLAAPLWSIVIERALKYRLTSMESLLKVSSLALTNSGTSSTDWPCDDLFGKDYENRPAYREGCFSQENPLRLYDEPLNEQKEDK